MLAKVNRVPVGDAFKAVTRKGRRVNTGHFVVAARSADAGVNRFGVIVSKQVDKRAVGRNLVRRRIQEVAVPFVKSTGSMDVIVRASPGAAELTWDETVSELTKAFNRLLK